MHSCIHRSLYRGDNSAQTMRRLYKLTGTSNELLAYKKNVSEEVKLREALTSLNFRWTLTKDAIRQDVGKVQTDLRQLRRSTGHSIEALPPTPFRIMPRKCSILPSIPPGKGFESASAVPPEFHYILDEVCDEENDNTDHVNVDGAVQIIPSHTSTDKESIHAIREKHLAVVDEPGRSVTFYEPPSSVDCKNNLHKKPGQENVLKEDKNCLAIDDSFNFLPSTNHHNISSVVDALNRNLLKVPDWEKTIPKCLKLHSSDDNRFRFSKTPLSTAGSFERSQSSSDSGFSANEDSRREQFVSPVGKQIMSVLNEGEWKRREYVRKTSFVGFDTWPISATTGQPFGNTLSKNTSGHIHHNLGDSGRGWKGEPRAYRDARARCWTCMDRFRQNAAFHRERLRVERENKPANLGEGYASQRRPVSSDTDRLEVNLSEEVLEFQDDEEQAPVLTSRRNVKRKGYSRRRMNELAEPRKGTKRKTLLSKRQISKELDSLTERHDHPRLTDRERERLRMLESKIRTFLATVIQDQRPASMVHIPQREDIMRVDISHH
ncbi:hypothetical protein PoB_000638000 [Plakobranchus ocellatus]|uniref:Uncharacterized protein n=1 Tax=Plakobranchus ocellatus TaxID=259542 RepID=A0AAV3YAR5_9GAST|nr:hypothetical protein PoB_000638000 [Plakobranchus ocellatus]